MAQHFTFYNRNTGNIEKVILTDQRSANRILDFSDQLVCVDGDYDWKKYKFDISQTPPVPVLKDITVTANYAALIRKYRNKKLSVSDWTQGSDSPLSDAEKTEWAMYRQSLRDITDIYNNNTVTSKEEFDNIIWPVKPE
jgi:hypothetical protein